MDKFIKYFVRISFVLLFAFIIVFFKIDRIEIVGREIDNYFYSFLDFKNINNKQDKFQEDPNIIIVDTSNIYDPANNMTNRKSLANIIKQLKNYSPACIALDVVFEENSKNPQDDIELTGQMKEGKNIIVGNTVNTKYKKLDILADNYKNFFSNCYFDIKEDIYVLPSPYKEDRKIFENILPFSFRIFEKASDDEKKAGRIIKEILKDYKTEIYLSYYNPILCKVITTDNRGNIDLVPKRISVFEKGFIFEVCSEEEKNLIRSNFSIQKENYFYLKPDFSGKDYEDLNKIFQKEIPEYNVTKYKKIFLLGDYYSPQNDKKISPMGERTPGVKLHAQVVKMLLNKYNTNEAKNIKIDIKDKIIFPVILNPIINFIFFVILLSLIILLFEYLYLNFAYTNFRKFYIIQNICSFIIIIAFVYIASEFIYSSFRLRLPVISSIIIIAIVFNFFLFYDYFVSVLLARIILKNTYSYLPDFVQSNLIKFYAENDFYNKLNILINVFEISLKYLSHIASMDIITKINKNELTIDKSNTGLLLDMKQKLKRPTTGVYRAILLDIYPRIIKDNRFLNITDEEAKTMNETMSEFIGLRNTFFHKSGSFYTNKTKKEKLNIYTDKMNQYLKLLSILKNFKIKKTDNDIILADIENKELNLFPLVVYSKCKYHKKEKRIFLYNKNLFEKNTDLEYDSDVTDCEPEFDNNRIHGVIENIEKI